MVYIYFVYLYSDLLENMEESSGWLLVHWLSFVHIALSSIPHQEMHFQFPLLLLF